MRDFPLYNGTFFYRDDPNQVVVSPMMIQKVQAYIVRQGAVRELLVFQHDITRLFQVIRGTLMPKENPEAAVLRVIAEESGLTSTVLIKKLGVTDLKIPGGPTRSGPLEAQRHHAFLLEAPAHTPDQWTHFAGGSIEESGVPFHFSWHPINANLLNLVKLAEMQHFISLLATKDTKT